MANPRLTIEFLESGATTVKFSSIAGVTPGRIDRASLQARKEHKRLCGLAGVEAARKKKEAEQEKLVAKAAEVQEVAEEAPPVEEVVEEEASPEESAPPPA